MMKISIPVLLVLFFSSASLFSQEKISKGERIHCDQQESFMHWENGKSTFSTAPNFEDLFKIVAPVTPWEWSEVGADHHPTELNPGGRAIPKYSQGRGNGTGRINYILPDPYREGRIFACSPTGGLFLSNDNGNSWSNAGTDQLPISGVSSVAVHPKEEMTWVITTGDGDDKFIFSDGVWLTKDGGQSYENLNGKKFNRSILPSEEPDKWMYISEVVAHPCDFNRLFVATSEGLFVTQNALEGSDKVKWRRISTTSCYDIHISQSHENWVFAGGKEFLQSKDCGATWEKGSYPDFPEPEAHPFSRLTFQSIPMTTSLLVGVTSAEKFSQSKLGEGTLWKFDYESQQWQFIRSLRQGMNNLITTRARALAVNPEDANWIVTGNVQPLYISRDGGQEFERIEKGQMHDDIHHLAWAPDGLLWVGHDGGVSVSNDDGLTWQSRNNGLGVANVFGLDVTQGSETVLYGAYDTGGNLLRDGSWYHTTWGDGFETIIDRQNPETMYATKQNGHINRSDDGGLTFDNSVTTGITKTEWHTWIRQHPKQSGTIFCSGTNLVRSRDKGETWEIILAADKLPGDMVTIFRFFTSEEHPNVIYAYVLDKTKVNPDLYVTFNSMATDPQNVRWERVPAIPKKGWIVGLTVDRDDPRQFWMAYKSSEPQGKLWRYNGSRYIDVTGNLGWSVVGAITQDPSSNERVYVGTNHGLFTRNKQEQEWRLLDGLPGTWIRSIAIDQVDREIYVGTFGRGVWKAPLLEE